MLPKELKPNPCTAIFLPIFTGTAEGYIDFTYRAENLSSSAFEYSTPSLVTDKETFPIKLLVHTWHLTSVTDAKGKVGTTLDPNLHARLCPLTKPVPVIVTIRDDEDEVAEGRMPERVGADM
jgi:hypothetical protein